MDEILDAIGSTDAVLIAGPTASGKSAAALNVAATAKNCGRRPLIINADSIQVYDGLRILTARPSPQDEALVPHALFGHVDPTRRYSTGDWIGDVSVCLEKTAADKSGFLPIFVGGTGLYFRALTAGLADIPRADSAILDRLRLEIAESGSAALHAKLAQLDPVSADRIKVTDTQRILRALSVLESTGCSLAEWQADTGPGLLADKELIRVAMLPERERLYRSIEIRFENMIDQGAVEEVSEFAKRRLNPDLPVMKAIGVRELAAYISGSCDLQSAIQSAKTRSRQYAKRQMTWIRTQMQDWKIATPESCI